MTGSSQEYDAVIIGAGHNGLCLAYYLGRAGYQVIVLEADSQIGGMAQSDEYLLPGFLHHAHANYLSFLDLKRPDVLGFHDIGVETIWPDAQHGICFRDDRPPLILYRPDQPHRSRRSIARFSERDARTYVRMKSRADRLGGTLGEAFFNTPSRERLDRQREATITAFEDFRFSHPLCTGSARSVIDDLFESAEMRTLLYRLTVELSGNLLDEGSDVAFLGYILWIIGRRRLPLGGMTAVPAALKAAVEAQGGEIRRGVPVGRIVVEGGRATAVLTSEGQRISARACIAAATSIDELYSTIVDETLLTNDRQAALREFRAARANSVASTKYCLKKAPRYRAADIDPDIEKCLMTFIGLDTPEEVLVVLEDVRRGGFPPPNAAMRINTLWDPSQAPAGCHAAGADTIFPSTRMIDTETMALLEASFGQALLECWAEYAPNMTPDNVLAAQFSLSSRSERKLLLNEGDAQYRSGIEGLYLCGGETYPGGGIHGACACNASRTIIKSNFL